MRNLDDIEDADEEEDWRREQYLPLHGPVQPRPEAFARPWGGDPRCSICRLNNPRGCSEHCTCHCHRP